MLKLYLNIESFGGVHYNIS